MSVLYWTCMLERWMREEKGETWAIEWRDRRANSPGLLLARLFFFLQKNEVKGGLMNWGQRGGRPDASRKYVCPVSRCWQREQRWGGTEAALWECHALGRSCWYPSVNLLLPRRSPQSETLLLRLLRRWSPPPGFRDVATPKAQFLHSLATFF